MMKQLAEKIIDGLYERKCIHDYKDGKIDFASLRIIMYEEIQSIIDEHMAELEYGESSFDAYMEKERGAHIPSTVMELQKKHFPSPMSPDAQPDLEKDGACDDYIPDMITDSAHLCKTCGREEYQHMGKNRVDSDIAKRARGLYKIDNEITDEIISKFSKEKQSEMTDTIRLMSQFAQQVIDERMPSEDEAKKEILSILDRYTPETPYIHLADATDEIIDYITSKLKQ